MNRIRCCMAVIALGIAAMTGRAETNGVVVLEARQTEITPHAGVEYRLAPGQLYQTTEPGPKARDQSQAWSMANEFVFRTALRSQCKLPGTTAIYHKTGIMVLFDKKEEGKRLRVFVRADMQTIEYKE